MGLYKVLHQTHGRYFHQTSHWPRAIHMQHETEMEENSDPHPEFGKHTMKSDWDQTCAHPYTQIMEQYTTLQAVSWYCCSAVPTHEQIVYH